MIEVGLWCLGYLLTVGIAHAIITVMNVCRDEDDDMLLAFIWPCYLVWSIIVWIVKGISIAVMFPFVAYSEYLDTKRAAEYEVAQLRIKNDAELKKTLDSINEKDSSQ